MSPTGPSDPTPPDRRPGPLAPTETDGAGPDDVEEADEESFPASDPPSSWSGGPGTPARRPQASRWTIEPGADDQGGPGVGGEDGEPGPW